MVDAYKSLREQVIKFSVNDRLGGVHHIQRVGDEEFAGHKAEMRDFDDLLSAVLFGKDGKPLLLRWVVFVLLQLSQLFYEKVVNESDQFHMPGQYF